MYDVLVIAFVLIIVDEMLEQENHAKLRSSKTKYMRYLVLQQMTHIPYFVFCKQANK